MSVRSYLRLLKNLLPRGRAWNHNDPVMNGLLAGKALELERVDDRMADLIRERDTRTTNELVEDHETEYDMTEWIPNTLEERQNVLTKKIRSIGGMHKSRYYSLAEDLGYTITIEEFTPSWAGPTTAGDPCGEQWIMYYWRVTIFYDQNNPNFVSYYTRLLETLEQNKPCNTCIIYAFTSEPPETPVPGDGFDEGFSDGFE